MQTQIKHKKILYFLLAATVFIGCKCKREITPDTICTDENTIKFPQDGVDRFFFKTGSYWVYKDSIDGLLDSVWVTEATEGRMDMRKKNYKTKGKCYEFKKIKVESNRNSQYHINFAEQTSPYGSTYEEEYFYIDILLPHSSLIYTRLRYKGENIDTAEVIENNKLSLVDSIKVLDHTFTNVLRIENPQGGIEPNAIMYYSKYNGLVKYKEKKSGHVWELLRYNTIK